MITLQELAAKIAPHTTVLMMGAGAGADSGAPTGAQLAEMLNTALDPERHVEGSLDEVSSVLELRHGRARVVENLRAILGGLQPTGGMLALPALGWSCIYTTNYDYLVERAYARAGVPMAIARSNFDYSMVERNPDATPLFKIHGCLSQDLADGHQARMVITEDDYRQYESFREALFKRLDLDLATHDLVVIGHSLRDPHVRRYMEEAARLQQRRQAPGRLFAVMHEEDAERATLLERRGYSIAFGSLDRFVEAMASQPVVVERIETAATPSNLPPALLPKTVDVNHAMRRNSNVSRLFNGSPASYGDIADGLTFKRSVEEQAIASLTDSTNLALAITGAGGVGKTTLARRIMSNLADMGYRCWEHDTNFPFLRDEWVHVEETLRAADEYGVLLVDDCPAILSQLNSLLGHLGNLENPALLVVVTANITQWRPRTKSPVFFSRGNVFDLSRLTDADINELLNLVEHESRIAQLIAAQFALQTRVQRFSELRRRCGADMYVCLKNVFASESLDAILLREYAELPSEVQDVYRLVAAVEAMGSQVHRQLVFRLLNVDAGTVSALLELLEGVVDELDISPRNGIYGLSTRHRVVAQTISKYKYADPQERFDLLYSIIRSLNPTVFLELRLAREICDRDFGIGSLASEVDQIALLQELIGAVPAERIPRHRLIGTYLRLGELELAEHAIQDAKEAVGIDPPIARYEVVLLTKRATETQGILHEDRYALLLQAENQAEIATKRYPNDPYAHVQRTEVALAVAELTDDTRMLDRAIALLDQHYDELREPNMREASRRFKDARRSFRRREGEGA